MSSAEYDPKTGKARIFFRFNGRLFNRTIKVKSERAASALCELIDQTITDLEWGKTSLPPEVDIASFLISGGKILACPKKQEQPKAKTLSDLVECYLADLPPHLEQTTRKMQEIHFRRLKEVFPAKPIVEFDKAVAQEYVSRRSKQKYRGRPIQPETIEIVTDASPGVGMGCTSIQRISAAFVELEGAQFPEGQGTTPLHDMVAD